MYMYINMVIVAMWGQKNQQFLDSDCFELVSNACTRRSICVFITLTYSFIPSLNSPVYQVEMLALLGHSQLSYIYFGSSAAHLECMAWWV